MDGAHRRRSLRPGRRFLPRRSGRRSQLRGPRVPSGPEPPHPPLGPRRPPRRSRVPRRRLLTCPRVFPAAYVPQAHALPLLRATRHALRVRRLPLLLATCHKLRACHHDQTSLPASQPPNSSRAPQPAASPPGRSGSSSPCHMEKRRPRACSAQQTPLSPLGRQRARPRSTGSLLCRWLGHQQRRLAASGPAQSESRALPKGVAGNSCP